jgi:hypothetical protein
MGWMETCAVDERMRFVMAIEAQEEPMAAVCRLWGEPEDRLQMVGALSRRGR